MASRRHGTAQALSSALALAALSLVWAGHAPGQAIDPQPSELRVSLLTAGPGVAIWELYGHNAIIIEEPATGQAVAYHYGLFDYGPGFFVNYLRGHLRYRMGAADADALIADYRAVGRSQWRQHLDLTPAQRSALLAALEENLRPEHRTYDYDYYRDNCSTRVRDALDRALGGVLQRELAARPGGGSFRFHTRRLSAMGGVASYLPLLFFLGLPIEPPLDAWEAAFLPTSLARSLTGVKLPSGGPLVLSEESIPPTAAPLPPEREAPPLWWPGFLVAGLSGGGALWWLGRVTRRWFAVAGGLWSLTHGLAGMLLAYFWWFSSHGDTHPNWNLALGNPIGLVVAVCWGTVALRSSRAPAASGCGEPLTWTIGAWLAAATAGLAGAAALLELVGLARQTNGELIALFLPVHLGLWAGQRCQRASQAKNPFPSLPS